MTNENVTKEHIENLYYQLHGKLVASLASQINDLILAEDLVQEAFVKAMQTWPVQGQPEHPRAWLAQTAKNLYLDRHRRKQNWNHKIRQQFEDTWQTWSLDMNSDNLYEPDLQDDMLKLMFTCCHPALNIEARVVLCLRAVCGLPLDQIAAAFVLPEKTMGQRIWRTKSKIKAAGIPYQIPPKDEWPQRIDAVLAVIYLMFNEGWLSRGEQGGYRQSLIHEALRLGHLIVNICNDSQSQSLLALMVLQHARRDGRFDRQGRIILLKDQERNLWHQNEINQGLKLLHHVFQSGAGQSVYALQAAIAATHCQAVEYRNTDWFEIVKLYEHLMALDPSPILAMNHAIALGERDGAEQGLRQLDTLRDSKVLQRYYLYHSARGAFLKQSGQLKEAKAAYKQALEHVANDTERHFLETVMLELEP